jgi:3-hydroxyisobutyrate dehydrogenase-like beta-hydroxyacid dehydrogenase
MSPDENITLHSRLGFIGLGYLGSRITHRLASAGFPMIVYDRNGTRATDLQAPNVRVAQHPEELAGEVDVVLSCLPHELALQEVYFAADGVLGAVRPGTKIIELSTVSPETSRQLYRAARKLDVPVLDVAISGSTLAAEAGKLTLFGGGDREVFAAAKPIFQAIASQWFYMGASGSGVAMKLVVNTLLGVGMQAIAEALALGSRLDLPRDLLLDTLAKTAVVAPAHAGKLASAKKQDYAPQFPIRLMLKDFGLIVAAATQSGLSMPATEAAAVVNFAEAVGGSEEDFSAVIRRMEQQPALDRVLPPAA